MPDCTCRSPLRRSWAGTATWSNASTGENFDDTGNIVGPITKAQAATDAYYTSPAGNFANAGTACYATANFTSACTTAYDNTDWGQTTQVISSPDLYALSPDKSILDSAAGFPGLLTVENGNLWYYQGQGTLDYIGTAVELAASGWNNSTVLSPVTVNGQLVLWARNNTTGALNQYPVDYDANGYPYLGTPTQLTVPGNPPLTSATYPALYAQVLHATSTNGYADLVTQNTNGQILDYPGTAPVSGTATFAAPQPLGLPADPFAATYPDGSGNLHTYTAAGVASPGLVMSASSSPSTAALPNGGYVTAYRSTDSNGDLMIYNSSTGITTNTTMGVHAGTNPSTAVDAAGLVEVAFDANNSVLYIYNQGTGVTTNTGSTMEANTSPSLAATPAGAFEAVFESSNTNFALYNVNTATAKVTNFGMETTSSPAIAANAAGTFAAIFQANTACLWTYNVSTNVATATTKGMMSTASPDIAAGPTGDFEIAFQTNQGDLYLWDYFLTAANYIGTTITMNHTTNPSITEEADGTFRVAIQNSAGHLYIYNPETGTGTDTGQTISTTASPSIAY